MSSWSVVFPFNPVPTPRPDFTIRDTKFGKKVITYYPATYPAYLAAIQQYLKSKELYNDNLDKVTRAKYGVMVNVIFYIGIPKGITNLTKLTHTTKPDIDNLLKAVIDGIFNLLKTNDSRVVGVKALKLKTIDKPRTDITLTGLDDTDDHIKPTETILKVNSVLSKAKAEQLKWSVILPYNPVPTPRPMIKFTLMEKEKNGKKIYKKHTYNSQNYDEYLRKIDSYLMRNNLYNDELNEVTNADLGVVANINFYCKVPKNQKKIVRILKTTTPDIDNLLKACIDSIFNNIKADDSRVVGVQALKFNVLVKPRTEVTLTGLSGE